MSEVEKGLARKILDGIVGLLSLVAFLGIAGVIGVAVFGEIKESADEWGAASATEQALEDAWNSSREAGEWDESSADADYWDGRTAMIEAELEEGRREAISEAMRPDTPSRNLNSSGSTSLAPASANGCDSSYPTLCLPSFPDLDCDDVSAHRFPVSPPDPHGFDGDSDGVGCEG